ncbi:MAG: aldo/keto reductase [Coriobacteriia bacterium]|nr:aldo/keto reductase [Coriobacteriia bacterium]
MEYRTLGKTGVKVSPLGFGIMRLPLKNGGRADNDTTLEDMDLEQSIAMVREAIDNGVNYLDTAYNYLNGKSEEITRMILEDGYREKVHLASKSPSWLWRDPGDFDRILSEQLERLQTDCIEFYLLHCLNGGTWKRAQRLGILDSLMQARADGRVKYIGFSFHDDYELFGEILDAAPWDFVQIQLNYLDTEFQAGLAGMREAAKRGMGVIVMEPLRGGSLVEVPRAAQAVFDAAPTKRSNVAWGLDYLWNMPEVSVVLSGMSSMAQMRENVALANAAYPGMLDESDLATIAQAKKAFDDCAAIPCTGCNYCVEYCPNHIVIPNNFTAYNLRFIYDDLQMAKDYYATQVTNFGRRAEFCVSCGLCEEHCPQHIKISEWLPKVHELLGE